MPICSSEKKNLHLLLSIIDRSLPCQPKATYPYPGTVAAKLACMKSNHRCICYAHFFQHFCFKAERCRVSRIPGAGLEELRDNAGNCPVLHCQRETKVSWSVEV